jgi:hypothetical protein
MTVLEKRFLIETSCVLPVAFALAITTVSFPQAVHADQLEDVYGVGQERIAQAAASQAEIDGLAEAARDAFRNYKQTLKEVEGLRVYNTRLEKQIQSQIRRIREIEKATRNAVIVQRQVPALTSKMIDSLANFVELDVPFHINERRERIQFLRDNQDRDNITIAEKFRQVMEAYKIEHEYGRKIDHYSDTILIKKKQREVNLLRIGRIALLYQTTDGNLTGAWDTRDKKWVKIGRGAYRDAVKRGLRIARKQAAIELMKVPLTPPESS